MSAVCFLIALVLSLVIALGLYWVLALISAGLLCWAIGLPGWTVPRR